MARKFSGSMQRLLRLRRSLEHQEEMKVALAAAHVGAARGGLDAARRQSRGEQDALQRELRDAEHPVDGSALQASGLQREAESGREQRLREQLTRVQAAHALQVEVLTARRRERKTLDLLEERSREAQRRERDRREQAALDEAFLLRLAPRGESKH
jgi:flagellar biosynthesis chaperone FliJ